MPLDAETRFGLVCPSALTVSLPASATTGGAGSALSGCALRTSLKTWAVSAAESCTVVAVEPLIVFVAAPVVATAIVKA